MNTKYTVPTCSDTAVCLCFFSPVGFLKPKMNFLYIENMLKQSNIPVFTVECVIGNQTPLLLDPTLRVRSNSSLFYKEHLYNLLVPKIPEQYTKLVFLDADIVFDTPNWLDQISEKLETTDVIQPFSVCHWLGPSNNEINKSGHSIVYVLNNQPAIPRYAHHPGFAWAMRRDFFEKIGGFFDKCLFGSGDSFFLDMFLVNNAYNPTHVVKCPLIASEHKKWLEHVKLIPRSFSYLPFTVFHLYHGSLHNRQYLTRYDAINNLIKTDWDNNFVVNKDGVYETTNAELNILLQTYFFSRKEDDVIEMPKVPKLRFGFPK